MTDLPSLRAALALVTKAQGDIYALPSADFMIGDISDRMCAIANDIRVWIEAEEASE